MEKHRQVVTKATAAPAWRRRASAVAAAALVAAAAGLLEGCTPPRHEVGNWEAQRSYLQDFEYIPPGKNESEAVLNSCQQEMTVKCNGHGECREWYTTAPGESAQSQNVLSFCMCETYWADPECRTQRKSQVVAFLLSVVLGVFGVDQFYLGYWLCGALKLLTFGGFGIWYIYDVVRIGSTPVYTVDQYKVANDLNHFAFVLVTIFVMGFLGFAISIRSIQLQRINKAKELLMLQAEAPPAAAAAEAGSWGPGQYYGAGFGGYGSTIGGSRQYSNA